MHLKDIFLWKKSPEVENKTEMSRIFVGPRTAMQHLLTDRSCQGQNKKIQLRRLQATNTLQLKLPLILGTLFAPNEENKLFKLTECNGNH